MTNEIQVPHISYNLLSWLIFFHSGQTVKAITAVYLYSSQAKWGFAEIQIHKEVSIEMRGRDWQSIHGHTAVIGDLKPRGLSVQEYCIAIVKCLGKL